jgi:hypothetical protein
VHGYWFPPPPNSCRQCEPALVRPACLSSLLLHCDLVLVSPWPHHSNTTTNTCLPYRHAHHHAALRQPNLASWAATTAGGDLHALGRPGNWGTPGAFRRLRPPQRASSPRAWPALYSMLRYWCLSQRCRCAGAWKRPCVCSSCRGRCATSGRARPRHGADSHRVDERARLLHAARPLQNLRLPTHCSGH